MDSSVLGHLQLRSRTNSSMLSDAINSFGPTRPGAFDFTLLFEDSILTIAPASLFLVAACIRTATLYRSPAKVESTSGRQVKVAFLSAFASLELVLLLMLVIVPGTTTKASVPAACLDFAASGVLFVLSSYEHSRTVAPSALIGVYLLITIPFDIARVRTLFLLDEYSQTKSIGTVLATSITLKAGLLLSEAASKRHALLGRYRDLPPEATSGPYSKSVFWWINPLLRRGFSSILEIGSLYTVDPALSSAVWKPKFQDSWMRSDKTGKNRLLKTIFSVLKWHLVISAVPRALLIGFKFSQPFLILRTIEYVSNKNDQPSNIGWGLVGAYALVYIGLALTTVSYTHLTNRFLVRIRSGLVSLIYQKTVDLSINDLDGSAALTLMSTDVERITDSARNFHDTWAALVEIGIALYLLSITLGAGCIAPVIVFGFAALAAAFITKLFPRYMKVWMECIESRVSFTSAILSSMRSIKLLGISNVAADMTQKLRIRENVLARGFRWLLLVKVLFQNVAMTLAPLATFAVYVVQANNAGRALETATAFSILSILALVEAPLSLLISSLPALVASLGCFTRIQDFLTKPSRQDHRLSLWNSSAQRQRNIGDWTVEGDIELRDRSQSTHVSTDEIVVLNDCSFGWDGAKNMIHDVNVRIKRRSLSMIIGPTGCGKSTLLKGILGETPSSTGFVYMATESIAFADQDPWMINSTIKDGICGESALDEMLYQEILDCCGLRQDLKTLPKGDLTVVGSKGISLSGGQKARLALARAVFARKDLLLLDDIFSGLDADTEEQIFRRLFSKSGPLERHGTTIVFVTHAVTRLSFADWVVALNKEGTVAEQGTYSNLKQAGGYVQSLAVRFKEASKETSDLKAAEAKGPFVQLVETKEEENMNLRARQTGDWNTYRHYFAAAGWRSIIFSLLESIVFIGCVKSPGLAVNYFTGPNTTAASNITFVIILASTAAVSLFALGACVWQIWLDIIPRASNGLHQRLLNTVMRAPLSFFTKTDSGTTLNRFSQDLTVIDNELPGSFIAVLLQLALFLFGADFMAATAVYFVATIPFIIIALVLIQRFYLRTSRQMRHLDLEAKAPLYTHFQETLSGLASIRAFGWVEPFCEKNMDLLERSQRPFYLLFCIQRWLAVVLDLMVAALATILMIIIVSLRDSIDPGLVGLGLLNVMSFNHSMSELVQMWTLMETSIGAIARVRDFVNNTESELKPIESITPTVDWPTEGAVELRHFAASYSEDSELVLSDINLIIRPGEKLGICGRTGSGKSSLLASLLHLLEFRDGSILIDGQDIAFTPRDLLRQRINVIPQEPYWIGTETVRFNLDPWGNDPSSDMALIAVLRKCQSWNVIEEKGGLDVKMEADFLSHGQRQLFCLARSLLRKSKVVILDEVSASVDVQTDAKMQAIIREEFHDCNVISVAHRLNTIVDFDRVAVLHAGRIVECDAPQTLLGRRESRFRELYEM